MAFILWPNIILLVCLVVVCSILGFIIYGSIVGFENTLKTFETLDNSSARQEEQLQ